MKNLPEHLTYLIGQSKDAAASPDIALKALSCLDLTTLNKTDTHESVRDFTARAFQKQGSAAAVCVYPEFVADARAKIEGATGVATVINFPFGNKRTAPTSADDTLAPAATPDTTAADITEAVMNGADEIDIVFDYASFLGGNDAEAFALLQAARDTCLALSTAEKPVRLKVILETAAFDDYNDLASACEMIALDIRPDFLKTSTGKHPGGGATPETAAVLMETAGLYDVGVKISGGVRTAADCARYMTLAASLMDSAKVAPQSFRIGASSVLDDLIATISPSSSAPEKKAASAGKPPRPDLY